MAPTNNMQKKKKKRLFGLCPLQHPKTVRSISVVIPPTSRRFTKKEIFFFFFFFWVVGGLILRRFPRVCLTQWELIHHDWVRDRTPVGNLVNRVRQLAIIS